MKIKYPLNLVFFVLSHALVFDCLGQWTEVAIGSGVTTGPRISAMVVTKTGKIIAGTSERGIYVSANNGTSWIPANKGLTDGNVISATINGSSIFVSGGEVFRSSNDGASWNKVTNGLPPFAAVVLEAAGGRLFALINNGTLFYSDDNGDSWLQMTNVPSTVSALIRSGTNVFLGSSEGVYRSTDLGMSWLLVNSGLPISRKVIQMGASENTLVAWILEAGIFVSTNGGASWNLSTLPVGYLRISQIGATILASYSQGPVWRSDDSGASWSLVQNLPYAGSILSVGNYFFASTPRGVYLSKDAGFTWSPSNIGMTDGRQSLSADGSLVITTDGFTVKVSSDLGVTWKSAAIGPYVFNSVLAKNNILYVSTSNGIWGSGDKGLTWGSSTTQGSDGSDKVLGNCEGNLFAADSYTLHRYLGGIWTPQSSNVRWISCFTGKNIRVFSGSFLAGDAYTGVFTSDNGGQSWQQVNNRLPQINSMAYDGTLLICGTSSGVYKSGNNGVTWILAGLGGININSVILDNGRILAAHRGIESSDDNGISWKSIMGEITSSLNSVHEITALAHSGSRIFATTSTGSVWMLPSAVVTGDIPDRNTVIKISPNPVVNELVISNGVAGSIAQASLKIVDLLGRTIQGEVIDSCYPISINTSFLISGAYVIELNERGKIFRTRFVKK
jgi:hypothetical protein